MLLLALSSFLLFSQARIYHGAFTLDTFSSTSKLNITVVYEMCFSIPPLHVDVEAVPVASSSFTFELDVYKIKALSFEGELIRTDQSTGWNFTTVTVSWKAFFLSGSNNFLYFYRNSANLTWASARKFCNTTLPNGDICSRTQICTKYNRVRIMLFTYGSHWAPISNATGDWVQLGKGNNLCKSLTSLNQTAVWSNTTGPCPPYNTTFDPCHLKGHVFCCGPAQ